MASPARCSPPVSAPPAGKERGKLEPAAGAGTAAAAADGTAAGAAAPGLEIGRGNRSMVSGNWSLSLYLFLSLICIRSHLG